MQEKLYIWQSQVRGYELDSQGIVNNATFINYFEQCRNDFARSLGVDYYEHHLAGYDFVVAGLEVKYRSPLRIGDEFYVSVAISDVTEKRIVFKQDIKRKRESFDRKDLVAEAIVHIAYVDISTGKSCITQAIKDKLSPFIFSENKLV